MSSAVPSAVPLASGANQRYFCHQCNRTVTIESPAGIELVCPICNGGFIEEFDLPSPSPVPSPPFFSLNSSAPPLFSSASPSPVFLSRSASFDLRNPTDIFSIIGTDPNLFRSTSTSSESAIFPSPSTTSDTGFFPSSSAGSDAFNPLDFLQRYIQTLLNDGANIQIVLEDGDRPIGNLGDYFFGPGLEQLIQQLAENDPNRYGTPPAAKSSIAVLPDVKITEDLLASDEAQCAVCKEVFEIGEEAKQMPCKHIFIRTAYFHGWICTTLVRCVVMSCQQMTRIMSSVGVQEIPHQLQLWGWRVPFLVVPLGHWRDLWIKTFWGKGQPQLSAGLGYLSHGHLGD
ncbi:hypothetical protein HPP92_015159 [Vanilla planifolia]|uniref:RING-type E3 ubiquitin transferase n=1 Tax=Vanilla planifolia TaxID=51239 RepID=A0A835UTE4_VANPL|nr:hypothetical protein HPP92_015159 [Vanilla planifolia]